MSISYSAPGKIILSGEHSVVYTKPAFVCAVDKKLTATITSGSSKNTQSVSKSIQFCEEVVTAYLKKESIPYTLKPYTISYSSEIPSGRGMGSSAAFCVATCAVLLHFLTGFSHEKQVVNTLAYRCEKYFHGMPSGVDVSASCFGGLIFYRKEFEFLKTISSLNFKIPKHFSEWMMLIDTGKPEESTQEMVKMVGERYNKYPQKMERIFTAIEKVTKRMVISIVKEDRPMFMDCIKENQEYLVELGIVSPKTQALLSSLSSLGVGKVSGAGGCKDSSGMVLFVGDIKKVKSVLKENELFPFQEDRDGVRLIHGQ